MKMEQIDKYEILSHFWILFKLSAPILITRIATAAMAFTDNIFLGHLGSKELAAGSMGNTIVTCAFYTVLGLNSALETLMSQAYGAKNYEMIGILLQRCLILQSFFFIPISFILTFIEPILNLCGYDTEIAFLTAQYVRLMTIGWYPQIFTRVLIQYLNSQTSMIPSMIVVLISNVLNVWKDS
jgi:multidrug resistance protein, MATE family